MSRKIEKNKTYRGRVVAAFAVVLFMIALETIYYGYHMKTNRDNIFSAYKDDQSQTVSILAERLEGLSEKDMESVINEVVDVSGSEWAFLTKGDDIIFVKDAATTAELSDMTASGLDEYMSKQKGIVSATAIVGSGYVIGIYADKSYVLSAYGVNDFEFYIVIAVIAAFLVLGGMVIEYAGRIGHMGRKVQRLEDELTARNEKFDEYERLTESYGEELRQKDIEPADKKSGRYYDMEVVDSLLSKSTDPELYPITFLFISVQMGDRYFSRDEIFGIMDFIKGCMGSNHVTAEMSKGNFVVLMYMTDMSTAEQIRDKMLESWKRTSANEAGAEIRTELRAVTDGDDPRKVFYGEEMNR